MYDASQGINDEDREVLELLKDKKYILIANKSDLTGIKSNSDAVYLSALTGEGVNELKQKLTEKICDINPESLDFVTNTRQQECLSKAKASIE